MAKFAVGDPVDRPGADGDHGRLDLSFTDPSGHSLSADAKQRRDLGAGPNAFGHARTVAGSGGTSRLAAIAADRGKWELKEPRECRSAGSSADRFCYRS